jgi:hypothetical protein
VKKKDLIFRVAPKIIGKNFVPKTALKSQAFRCRNQVRLPRCASGLKKFHPGRHGHGGHQRAYFESSRCFAVMSQFESLLPTDIVEELDL